MVLYSYLFKNFLQFVVIHTKVLVQSIKQKYMFFLEFCCFFCDPADGGNLIFGFSTFSKSSLNIWNFSLHVLLKHCMENFEHYFASM